jgi:hypothetical protein
MFRFRRPPRALWLFLGLIVSAGALFGNLLDAAGIAAFCFFISSIEGKPAWRFWYDPPGDVDSGRSMGRFNSNQRVGATSPREIARLPRTTPTFSRAPSAGRPRSERL